MIYKDENMSDEEASAILAMGYFAVLKPTEGIIVHRNGQGFVIKRSKDGEEVGITRDDEVLKYPHNQFVWLHDEPVGNA